MRDVLVCLCLCGGALTLSAATAEESAPLERSRAAISAESYDLCVPEQARIWGKGTFPRFIVWPTQAFDTQLKKSLASLRAAEEAIRLDERNAFAHALLARYYLVPDDTYDLAAASWDRLFAEGLGVSFPSMYYDVDTKRLFLSYLDAEGITIYRYGQFGIDMMDELPDETNVLYWEAHAGRIPPDLEPAGVIHWRDVERIKTGNWVWWIRLNNKLTLRSDRGKEKTMEEVKVALLGGVGQFSWHLDWYDLWKHGKINIRTHTYGPADYNARLRSVVLGLVDAEHRIEAPKPPRPGPGW